MNILDGYALLSGEESCWGGDWSRAEEAFCFPEQVVAVVSPAQSTKSSVQGPFTGDILGPATTQVGAMVVPSRTTAVGSPEEEVVWPELLSPIA